MTKPAGAQITDKPSTARVRHWRRGIAISATAILAPLLLLVLAEVILRVCGVGTSAAATRPCTDDGRPAYCDNQAFAAPFSHLARTGNRARMSSLQQKLQGRTESS